MVIFLLLRKRKIKHSIVTVNYYFEVDETKGHFN